VVGEVLGCMGNDSLSDVSERLSDKWDMSDSELGVDGSDVTWGNVQSEPVVTGIELTSC